MSVRRAVTFFILVVALSGCATLQPGAPGRSPGTRVAQLSAQPGDSGKNDAQRPPRYPYRSKHCESLKGSQKAWGWTSQGLAIVAGGMAAAGALPIAALLAGASSAGLGVYAGFKTADYVKSCTTGNAPEKKTPAKHKTARRTSSDLPPLTISGVLTIVAGMLAAI